MIDLKDLSLVSGKAAWMAYLVTICNIFNSLDTLNFDNICF